MPSRNTNLTAARRAKNDEFYTQWADIEREMVEYVNHNPDVFRDKTVLLPCDDPEWSNFTRFFSLCFTEYGLKRLISTSYAPESKPDGIPYQPTEFESSDPAFDKVKTTARGKKFILERKDVNGDGKIDIDDLKWEYLSGDGDFRSEEVTSLRDEADIVITNPPFSLFREYIAWLMEGDVKFAAIGSLNAITYKEVFPLIQSNHIWLGTSQPKRFRDGNFSDPSKMKTFGNIKWFTNIEHARRFKTRTFMTAAENKRVSTHSQVQGIGYLKYDNYDAIEVPYVDAIPSDYTGVMGVPVSFLDNYNPDQFEILGVTDRGNPYGLTTKVYDSQTPNFSDLNRRGAIRNPDGTYRSTYARLLVRHKVREAK